MIANDTEKTMQVTAKALNEIFEGLGWMLLVFEFDGPGMSNYISNADRKSMIVTLREMADRLESKMDNPDIVNLPGGKIQ